MKRKHRLSLAALGLAIFTVSTITVQAQFNCVTNNGTITITKYTGSGGAVTIPDTISGLPVTSIRGSYPGAFYGRTDVTSITIPDSVITIGGLGSDPCFGDFFGCPSLTSVTLGNHVASISAGAFQFCTSLTNVIIPNSVTAIADEAFYGCTSLRAIAVEPANPAYSSVDGVLFNKSQTTLLKYPGGRAASYAIPSGVRSVGREAFGLCLRLTSITIPDSVISIEDGYNFDDLVHVWDVSAFLGCSSLTNIAIGKGLTRIGAYAFKGCTSLRKITIPDNVTSFGDVAFADCTSLTSITLGNSVNSIGDWAFFGCTGLTSITIPDTVTSVGGWAFYGCSSLTSVTIPDSVINIGEQAFRFCTSLTNVTIPDSGVISIGAGAFGSCHSLTTVCFEGNAPQYQASSIWVGPPFEGATNVTVHYLPGTLGWTNTYAERPTAPWVLPYPIILTTAPNFGIQTNAFGFRISWATNVPVVVEASTTLANPVWLPVSTNTLTEGWCDFRDPQWTNYPSRFYRVRSQ